jgi:hypothetical protein
MAKQPTFYRQTISISIELKQRMDEVSDQVNWSAIAAAAFEKKLEDIAAEQRKEKTVEDVIRRLRPSQVQEDDPYAAGKKVGDQWGRNFATENEMFNLILEYTRFRGAYFQNKLPADTSWADSLYFLMDDKYAGNHAASQKFWAKLGVTKEKQRSAYFMGGFADAVVELWRQIEPHLRVK